MGNLEIPFLGPKEGLSGGPSWSHLKNPLGIFNSTFNKDLLRCYFSLLLGAKNIKIKHKNEIFPGLSRDFGGGLVYAFSPP